MTLLLGSNNGLADISKTKRLFIGEKAPFDGVLFDEESVRQIDVGLLEKDLCEKKLSNQSCEMMPSWGWHEFVAGIFVGGLVIYGIQSH